jgi:periplasmic divalent cation tolerance protein
MADSGDLILILTTMPNDDRAEQVARNLVDEGLAACVNVHAPMTSVYRWQGKIEHAPERQLVIKTTPQRRPRLEARLRELHPYELPEVIVLSAGASDAYGKWVTESTQSG